MIDKNLLRESVEKAIEGTDLFIVDITVSPQNNIVVELDSPGSLDIDTCAAVTRAIEKDFDRDVEDYDLEVGSAGLTAPFRVRGQYEKNIGNEIEILTRDGPKNQGHSYGGRRRRLHFRISGESKGAGSQAPRAQNRDRDPPVCHGQAGEVSYLVQVNFPAQSGLILRNFKGRSGPAGL